MHAVPMDKLDWFCEDLRLWLKLQRMADASGVKVTSERKVFCWIDDERHNVRIDIHQLPAKK